MELRSSTAKGTANTVWGYVPDRGERIVAPTIPSEVVSPEGSPTGWGILKEIYNRGWQRTNNTNNFLSFLPLSHIHSKPLCSECQCAK